MPPSLRAAFIQQVQNDAPEQYALERTADGVQASHPKQDLRLRATDRGIALSNKQDDAPLTLSLTEVSGRPVADPEIKHDAHRVTLKRGNIDEWYVHGPLGVEQGFTVHKPLGDDDTITLAMNVEGGYSVTHANNGLVWSRGNHRLKTSDLYAYDAAGRALESSMSANGSRLIFDVDVAQARYPIVIDPLWTEVDKVLPTVDASGDRFGRSVSLSGDTALIGADLDSDAGTQAGAAYVFIRSGGSWLLEQKLTAGTTGDQFGVSVSLDGDTAVVGARLDDDAASAAGAAFVFTRSGAAWTEQQKLVASDGAANDQFGTSVSVDGDTVVIGATDDDDDGNSSGSAYVFVKSGTTWTEQQKLTASDAAAGDQFGYAAAVSGDTVVVGKDRSGFGAAYVFVRSGTTWAEEQILTPAGGPTGYFGRSVAVDGDTTIVGDHSDGGWAGTAYVFVRSGSTWSEQQKLTASDAATLDNFGRSVSIDGNTVVVGADSDDDDGSVSGSAYVFVRSGSTWSEQQKLTASDAAGGDKFGTSVSVHGDTVIASAAYADLDAGAAYLFGRAGTVWSEEGKGRPTADATGDSFGYSVDIDGDTAIVGAPSDDDNGTSAGAAYVFVASGGTWALQQKLAVADGGALGRSVSVDDNTAIVGAVGDDDNGSSSGAAYVFVRSGTVWTEQQKLTASDGAASDQFGYRVDLSGGTAVVSAAFDDDDGSSSGSAYVFVRSGTTWTQQQKLTASDAAAGDWFGTSVGVDGDTVVVGSHYDDDDGSQSGSAYVFVRSGSTWTEQQKLTASDAATIDWFGRRVSIDGDTIVVGAIGNDDNGSVSGSAYVFVRSGSTWSEQQKLLASDGSSFDAFGSSVDILGDAILIGATQLDASQGSAYAFIRSGTTWTERDKLSATDGAPYDYFGTVGLSADTAVIGARGNGSLGDSAGAAYFFSLTCGNGAIDGAEECDDGASNSDTIPNACRTWCENAGCGDAVVDSGEACDDGNTASGDGCNAICLLEIGQSCSGNGECASGVCDSLGSNTCEPANVCGNGTVDAGEACDDGNTSNGDGCNSSCLLENGQSCTNNNQCVSGVCDTVGSNTCEPANTCGNGALEGSEVCDDGNTTPNDGCSAACLLENGEACTNNSQCASSVCDTLGSNTCEPANSCGNGVLEGSEICDDGGTANGDGCNSSCELENGQPCTNNNQCASNVCDTVGSNTCEPANSCGNGVLEGSEICDDGNTSNGDGCSSACLLENGQSCSNNNECASGVCDTLGSNTCEPADVCGNGTLDSGEACDDGGTANGDGCNATCELENGEPCTNNSQCASNACDTLGSNTCEPANTCGNGTVESGEACDDGGTQNGDGCNSSCELENGEPCTNNSQCASNVCDTVGSNTCEPANSCGNGALESGEACDDGGTSNGDGCNATCELENGEPCTNDSQCGSGVCDTVGSNTCEPANSCGNGTLEAGEVCDDGNTATGDGCDNSCLLEIGEPCGNDNECTSNVCNTGAMPPVCAPPAGCGNGAPDPGEACDDGNTNNGDGCNSACLLEDGEPCSDDSECASNACDTLGSNTCEPSDMCGNGTVESGEACDDGGTSNGDGCNSTCELENGEPCTNNNQCASNACDTLGSNTCEPANSCGNGTVEAGEACDDGGTLNGDGCNNTCELEDGEPCSNNSECASGVCDAVGSNTCEPANSCGNGVLDGGEACDDGGTLNGDGCNATCFFEDGEPCTNDSQCASSVCDTAGSNTCEPANACGNGRVEGAEACDDGGTSNGDGCSSTCLLEIDEPCSNNNECTSNVCNMTAMPPVCAPPAGCGNGALDAGEACDDGNNTPGDGCDAVCLLEDGEPCTDDGQCGSMACDSVGSNTCEPAGSCGNGTLDVGEACDDGNTTGGDGCSGSCLIEINQPCTDNSQCETGVCDVTGSGTCEASSGCGNGMLDSGEACDDGNTSPGDGCDSSCLLEIDEPCTLSTECATNYCDTAQSPAVCTTPVTVCGNGALEALEACDDGNTIDDDGCSATCLLEDNQPCTDGVQCVSGLCDTSMSPALCEPTVTAKNTPIGRWHGGGCSVGASGSSHSTTAMIWLLALLVLNGAGRRRR